MKKILVGLVFFVLVIFVSGVVVFLYRKNEFSNVLNKSVDRGEPSVVLKKLGEHMLLPSATPNIGTVVEIQKLREKSAFFKDAKNGDIVVIYDDRAIIYDEKQDKIVNVGMIPKASKKSSGSAEMEK